MRGLDRFGVEQGPGPASITPARVVGLVMFALALVASGCASIVVHDRPVLDRNPRDKANSVTSAPADALAWLESGLTLDRNHPDWAIAAYRDAALKALPHVLSEGVSTELDIEHATGAQAAYRRAIEYALLTAHRQALAERTTWTEVLARAGITVKGKVSLYEPDQWEEVLPSRRFEVKGFRHRSGQGGIGAPVVLYLSRGMESAQLRAQAAGLPADPSEANFPRLVYRAASAVLRPSKSDGQPQAVLELHDPMREPAMWWQATPNGPSLPLAYDMTVSTARQFHDSNLNLVGPLGVLFPSEYDGKTGLYMIDPYQPGKIPVVFVHGLMSSPEAWANAMNELRGDPSLRDRYQFWMFFYSTGNPILASAARFRHALNEVRAKFDPEQRDPAFDHMIVVGHSMGGILSRLSICSSGLTLWNEACKVPPDQVELAPEIKDMLTTSLIFEPVPTVNRVVFIATPHRGSPLGDELIGRVVSRLISVPKDILELRMVLAQLNGDSNISSIYRNRRYATSVAQLGTGNPVLQAISRLPLCDSVPYHSIVGHNGREPLPGGSDGVVPYTSAHVEGALSEVVVRSNHSVQDTEAAVTEIRRILVLHFQEYRAEQAALAHGEDPPVRIVRPTGSTPVRYAQSSQEGDREADRVARGDPFPRLRITR